MGRAYDFVVAAVIYLVAVVIHLISIELFAPNTPLYAVASSASTLNGAQRASLWSEILIVWVPLAAIIGITGWVFIREFRRQVQTATGQRPP